MSIITNLIINPIYEIYNYCKPFIINYTEYIYNDDIDLIDNNIDLIDNKKKKYLILDQIQQMIYIIIIIK